MIKFLLVSILCVTYVQSANILYVSIIPSPSHHIWNRALAFALAQKGHNVTQIGPDKDEIKPANYHHIYTEKIYEAFHETVDMLEMAESTPTQNVLSFFVNFCLLLCQLALKSDGFRQLLNYPENYKFDLIIFDVTAGPCFYPLIHKFNYPPSIGVTPFLLPPYISYNFGNQRNPAYIPYYGLPYTNDMTFIERVWNHIFTYGETFIRNFKQYQQEYEEAKTVFGENIPPMDELERHISLILTNHDPILDYPQPLAPNFISVGGLHTRKPNKIPEDLQAVLDGAKNGVIVFSLGTNIRSDTLDKKTQRALLDAFGKLSQTVIWKFESEIENIPKNVHVMKWLPQNDILGHRNVKLFIGHGGALSTQESIFHGVPIICVPFFFDQHVNTRNIIYRKIGISLDYKKITQEYVLGKIREILDNPMYAENMKRVSDIFRDRTETPLERAVFWVEYAIRHGGAQFLNTPARDLPYYKVLGLDVLGFGVLVVLVFCLLVSKCVKFVCRQLKTDPKIKVN